VRKFLASAALIIAMANPASAETIAVSMARFDDNFGTVIRNAMVAYARSIDGVTIQVEDAQGDVARQLDQIKNFAANKVDAIIVQPQDTSATQAMTDVAAAAGVPLVYLNREPVNIDTLPANQALVASNERDSGTLETKEVCRLFKKAGKTEASVYVIMGELSNQAAVQRTQDILDVIGGSDCGVRINIIDKQTSNWQREQAQNLMTNWLSSGTPFDGVIANNDESAIGAIQAIKASGADVKPYLIAGIDASQDGMQAMQAGDLDVTVFQDAAGQGKGAVDAALALAHGKKIDRKVFIPFQLVTPDNLAEYLKKN
jgi:inositol transport system substrate-binding protein